MDFITSSQDPFKNPKRAISIFLFLVSLSLIIQYTLIATILIIISIALISFDQGLQVNIKKRSFRLYRSVFKIHWGEWHDVSYFSDLFILARKGSKSFLSPSLAQQSSVSMSVFDVFLAKKNHRKRILVKTFRNKDKAISFAEELSNDLNMPLVHYDPPMSRRTKALRNRRSRHR